MGYEEAEFCCRLRKVGLRSVAEPRARILHHVGFTGRVGLKYSYASYRGRLRFAQFYFGRVFGTAYALPVLGFHAFIQSLKRGFSGFSPYYFALVDEIRGVAFDRASVEGMSTRAIFRWGSKR